MLRCRDIACLCASLSLTWSVQVTKGAWLCSQQFLWLLDNSSSHSDTTVYGCWLCPPVHLCIPFAELTVTVPSVRRYWNFIMNWSKKLKDSKFCRPRYLEISPGRSQISPKNTASQAGESWHGTRKGHCRMILVDYSLWLGYWPQIVPDQFPGQRNRLIAGDVWGVRSSPGVTAKLPQPKHDTVSGRQSWFTLRTRTLHPHLSLWSIQKTPCP